MRAVKPYIISKGYRGRRNRSIRNISIIMICAFALGGIANLYYKQVYKYFTNKPEPIQLAQPLLQEPIKQELPKVSHSTAPRTFPKKILPLTQPLLQEPIKQELPKVSPPTASRTVTKKNLPSGTPDRAKSPDPKKVLVWKWRTPGEKPFGNRDGKKAIKMFNLQEEVKTGLLAAIKKGEFKPHRIVIGDRMNQMISGNYKIYTNIVADFNNPTYKDGINADLYQFDYKGKQYFLAKDYASFNWCWWMKDVSGEIDPKSAVAYRYSGAAYHKKGQYDKAIVDYTKAIELDPEDVDTYLYRGSVYQKLGKDAEAERDFSMARQLEEGR